MFFRARVSILILMLCLAGAVRSGAQQFASAKDGDVLEVQGVVTQAPILFNRQACRAMLQNSAEGIVIFTPEPSKILGVFREGDEVRIKGTVSHYQGMAQLDPQSVQVLSRGNPVLAEPLGGRDLTAVGAGALISVEGPIRHFDAMKGMLSLTSQGKTIDVSIPLSAGTEILARAGQAGQGHWHCLAGRHYAGTKSLSLSS
jgi:hypothetical protein